MKEKVTPLNKLRPAITLNTPIEDKTLFAQAPKKYYSDTAYYQAFIFKLFDGTVLFSNLLLNDNQDLDDEFFSLDLGHPNIMTYSENGSLKFVPYHIDILFDDDITSYGIPTDEMIEQYHMYNIMHDNLKSDGFTLISVKDIQKKYPDIECLPTLQERQNITVGSDVKMFSDIETEEGSNKYLSVATWAVVTESEDGSYIGQVHTSIFPDMYIQDGDFIKFSAEHIFEIHPERNYRLVA